jgi:hypothetical protein
MKRIPLTKGYEAIVDDEDYEYLMQWVWRAKCRAGETIYAVGRRWALGMHRVIIGAGDGEEVDHINGNGLDNRKVNLRLCSRAENSRNRRKQKNNTSGFRGVSKLRIRYKNTSGNVKTYEYYLAHLEVDGRVFSSTHNDLLSAARARDEMAIKHHGEFARLNFPQENR